MRSSQFSLVLLAVGMLGCNQPMVTSDFPAPMPAAEARSTLVILRAKVAYGMYGGVMIQIDGHYIGNIGRNDRVEVALPPGVHSISIPGATQSLTMLSNKTYYVLATPGSDLPLSILNKEKIVQRLMETRLYATNIQ